MAIIVGALFRIMLFLTDNFDYSNKFEVVEGFLSIILAVNDELYPRASICWK